MPCSWRRGQSDAQHGSSQNPSFMQPRPATASCIPSKLTVNFVLPYALSWPPKRSQVVPRYLLFLAFPCLFRCATQNDCALTIKPILDLVIVPATTGQMGVLPGHVATIAELAWLPHSIESMLILFRKLAEFTQKLSSATTDFEKAEAQIGIDVHSALNSALTG
ncbi:metacaspase-1-like [Hibiscus syriacus]|uniref:Metacaspase-1-like n=1 Tax=Hibiscus syriacus TaxID=106335 RepID=A0A6A2XA80_HIBSY|nr:metacaspase-1-like [Hibiscus syriacus]